MAMSTTYGLDQDAIDYVNGLIHICRDGEMGFKTASEGIENDPDLRAELLQYSVERGEFANRLQSELTSAGVETAKSGSITGSLHRGWISLREALTGNKTHETKAVIAECVRGEEAAVAEYDKVDRSTLPASLQTLVDSQSRQISTILSRLKRIEDLNG